MGLALQIGSWMLWFPLRVLGINALLRAGARRFPLILTYMAVSFVLAAAQIPMSLAHLRSARKSGEWFQSLNSIGESITYLLIFAVVLSLIERATALAARTRLLRVALLGGGMLAMTASFAAHCDPRVPSGVWMTAWMRDAYFIAAVLDLAVWGMLVSSQKRDLCLLMLTGGMGIMFAGEAIGSAVKNVAVHYRSIAAFYVGHAIRVLADAAFQYVWWQAFRREAAKRESQ